jgi:peptide/nickel transport system permease protein
MGGPSSRLATKAVPREPRGQEPGLFRTLHLVLREWRQIRRRVSTLVSLLIICATLAAAVGAPYIAPRAPEAQNLDRRLTPPLGFGGSTEHLLGTDALGRDVLSRIIYGARVSILVGMSAVFVSMVLGTAVGLMAGWYGGLLDALTMRLADLVFAFPFLLLALLLLALLGGGLRNVIIALSATGWVIYARLVRAEVLALKEREFVLAAVSLGTGVTRILVRHVLPNLLASLVVVGTLEVGTAILSEAALSFLGLGIPPSVPSWGQMVEAGRRYIYTAWWLTTIPGGAIALVVLSVNFVGDWLRDRLDPVMRVGRTA